MALSYTVNELRELLKSLTQDLEKSAWGNMTAAQRVRTGTVRLEKIARVYRRESMLETKNNKTKKTK